MNKKGIQAAKELADYVDFGRLETARLIRFMEGVGDHQHSYKMGFDYYLHGANESNCDFQLFRTKELTAAWEKGRKAAGAAS